MATTVDTRQRKDDGSDHRLSGALREPIVTIVHAKEAFGSQRVRRIGTEDISEISGMLRERGCSPSTRATHLRVLSACFQAAVAIASPTRTRFRNFGRHRDLARSGKRPRTPRTRELPRLFAHLKTEPYRRLCVVALKTGMRQGEPVALRWSDVDRTRATASSRNGPGWIRTTDLGIKSPTSNYLSLAQIEGFLACLSRLAPSLDNYRYVP